MKKSNRRGFFGVAAIVTVLTISVGLLGFTSDKRNQELIKNLEIFISVYKELNNYYVDQPDPKELIRAGIDEMLATLDPYTVYYPEEEMDDFRFMTTGEYGGVGAVISMSDSCYVMVREIYKDFPADVMGLRPGDYFLEVDGKDVKDFKTGQVSEILRGTPETDVKVKMLRPGTTEPFEVIGKRKKIQINPVAYYGMLDAETGYIGLSSFTDHCSNEVKKALIDLRDNQGAKRLVLDLRSNPGGLLNEAIDIVNLFVPRGKCVLTTRGRFVNLEKRYSTTSEPVDTLMPLVTLINRASASASEIVAGALQDLDRAVIIGQRSFGKGLVQSTREVSYGGGLKLTTAKYYIPSGRCIQALDYSNRDKDGAVGYVPDSLISEFKTAGGRTVFDGGGVSPDINITGEKYANVTLALLASDAIFHYAVKYRNAHESIASAEKFAITDADYADFCSFVANDYPKFSYKNRSSDAFERLTTAAKSDQYYEENKDLFEQLGQALKPVLSKDLKNSEDDIRELIEDEILISYYYSKGQVPHALKTDSTVIRAVELFNDEVRYNGLLDGSVPSHAGDKRTANKVETE